MVNPQASGEQSKFYEENVKKLLLKHSGGFAVYHGKLGDNYDYYETKEDLMKACPFHDDGKIRFGTLPLIIDILEEQFRRRDEAERVA
jgi:hypothetical protein